MRVRWPWVRKPRDEVDESAMEQLGREYASSLGLMFQVTGGFELQATFQGLERVGSNKETIRIVIKILDGEEDDLSQSIRQAAEARAKRLGLTSVCILYGRL